MKRVLFIAPHSFPIKSSESICNSKVVYALAEAGYLVDVFSCDDPSTYPADCDIDNYLKNNKNINIINVDAYWHVLSRKHSLFLNIKNLLINVNILFKTGYFFNGISTPYSIIKAVKNTIKKNGNMPYDVIITRGAHLVGIYMKKKYGLRWIANWNDPYPFPQPYGQGFDTKLPFFERLIYRDYQKYADMHTFPCERLRQYMLKCFTHVKLDQTYVIHHMAHSGLTKFFTAPKDDDGVLKLVSCGWVGKPRKPEVFLKALAESIKEIDNVPVVCYFVGYYEEKLQKLVEELGISEIVEFIPPQNYTDCMKFISRCDISLVIETICEEGIYLPTKVVDSVQCEIPIFCVSPSEGTLNDIINKYHIGYSSDINNQSDVKNKINQLFIDYKEGKLPKSNKQMIPVFFEKYIVSQYDKIIN